MSEEVLGHLEFWTQFRRYVEDHKIDIRLSKPGKSATSNVVLRRSYFSVRPWRLLKDDRLGVSVQFDGPDPKARYELVARQHRQKLDERLSALGVVDWQPGKISLSRSNAPSTPDTWEERYQWLANAINTTCAAFNEIFLLCLNSS